MNALDALVPPLVGLGVVRLYSLVKFIVRLPARTSKPTDPVMQFYGKTTVNVDEPELK